MSRYYAKVISKSDNRFVLKQYTRRTHYLQRLLLSAISLITTAGSSMLNTNFEMQNENDTNRSYPVIFGPQTYLQVMENMINNLADLKQNIT